MEKCRFDANKRFANVLGIVGAGGFGMSLSEALRGFDYSAGAAILLIILVTVFFLDIFGSLLCKVLIDGTDKGRIAAYFLFSTLLVIGLETLLVR